MLKKWMQLLHKLKCAIVLPTFTVGLCSSISWSYFMVGMVGTMWVSAKVACAICTETGHWEWQCDKEKLMTFQSKVMVLTQQYGSYCLLCIGTHALQFLNKQLAWRWCILHEVQTFDNVFCWICVFHGVAISSWQLVVLSGVLPNLWRWQSNSLLSVPVSSQRNMPFSAAAWSSTGLTLVPLPDAPWNTTVPPCTYSLLLGTSDNTQSNSICAHPSFFTEKHAIVCWCMVFYRDTIISSWCSMECHCASREAKIRPWQAITTKMLPPQHRPLQQRAPVPFQADSAGSSSYST